MSDPFAFEGSRDPYIKIWRRLQNGEPLDSTEDALAAEVMKAHTEFHAIWNSPDDYRDYDFYAAEEPNPFLHVALHVTIETQLRTGDPPSTRRYAEKRLAQGADAHQVAHELGEVLVGEIIKVMRSGKPFNRVRYDKALEAQLRRKGTR
ncbi:MAG: DUF1841 family protein [bacterium]